MFRVLRKIFGVVKSSLRMQQRSGGWWWCEVCGCAVLERAGSAVLGVSLCLCTRLHPQLCICSAHCALSRPVTWCSLCSVGGATGCGETSYRDNSTESGWRGSNGSISCVDKNAGLRLIRVMTTSPRHHLSTAAASRVVAWPIFWPTTQLPAHCCPLQSTAKMNWEQGEKNGRL